MNNSIKGFTKSLRVALKLLNDVFLVSKIRAHGRVMWSDLEKWMDKNNLTLSGLIHSLLVFAFTGVIMGVVVSLIGAVSGTFAHTEDDFFWVRAIIVLGTVVLFVGFAPILAILHLSRSLYDLVLRGGEVVAEVLEKRTGMSTKIVSQLHELRDRRNLSGALLSFYAAYSLAIVVLLAKPDVYALFWILVVTLIVSSVMAFRHRIGVLGYGITKLVMSAFYGVVGAFVAFVMLNFIFKKLILLAWPNLFTETHALRVMVVTTILTFFVVTIWNVFTIRIAGEEEKLWEGRMRIRPESLEITGVDHSGKPNKFAIKQRKKFHMPHFTFHRSRRFWAAVALIALFIGVMVGLISNPLAKVDTSDPEILAVLVVAGIVLFALLFIGEEKHVQTQTSHSHPKE